MGTPVEKKHVYRNLLGSWDYQETRYNLNYKLYREADSHRKMLKLKELWILPLFLFCGFSYGAEQDEFAWEDSYDYEDEGSYGDEEGRNTVIVSILDILDESRSLQLKPEEFIYPFAGEHRPMLASNLVDSVQGVAAGFRSKRVVQAQGKRKKGKRLSAKNVGKRSGISVSGGTGVDGLRLGGPGEAQGTGAGGIPRLSDSKGTQSRTKVVLPPFEISGTFGTESEQFIVIGNRYYTIEDKLKGSRSLRKVKLIGIDEQFAYFTYNDVSFVKKIKALESIF
jgi:hypothetical protein